MQPPGSTLGVGDEPDAAAGRQLGAGADRPRSSGLRRSDRVAVGGARASARREGVAAAACRRRPARGRAGLGAGRSAASTSSVRPCRRRAAACGASSQLRGDGDVAARPRGRRRAAMAASRPRSCRWRPSASRRRPCPRRSPRAGRARSRRVASRGDVASLPPRPRRRCARAAGPVRSTGDRRPGARSGHGAQPRDVARVAGVRRRTHRRRSWLMHDLAGLLERPDDPDDVALRLLDGLRGGPGRAVDLLGQVRRPPAPTCCRMILSRTSSRTPLSATASSLASTWRSTSCTERSSRVTMSSNTNIRLAGPRRPARRRRSRGPRGSGARWRGRRG